MVGRYETALEENKRKRPSTKASKPRKKATAVGEADKWKVD